MKMIKVCIIGCGMIAKSAHIPAYQAYPRDFEITAVCDFAEAVAKKQRRKIISVITIPTRRKC